MAIITNKNTTQQPLLTPVGNLLGTQVVKFIYAPRVYVKASVDATPTIPTLKSDGNTPTGWLDLGSVVGTVKVGVEKKVKQVKTGIDNYFRAAYTDEKIGTCEFSLSQLDDYVFNNVTGLSSSTINTGSTYTFAVGSEDLSQQAILMVCQNKLDGREWQYYNPNAYLNYSIEDNGDEMQLKISGLLPFFTAAGQTKEQYLATTIFR